MRGRAWHAALQWELSVRSWDESATQRRKRRGEKTHIHLDRTKKYKCARIRPRGIAPFAGFKNKGSLWSCAGSVHLVVPSAAKSDNERKQRGKRKFAIYWPCVLEISRNVYTLQCKLKSNKAKEMSEQVCFHAAYV